MEELPNSIVETRTELMISSSGEGNPILRTAHFLKPTVTSIDEQISKPSSLPLPHRFEPQNWPLTVTFHGWRHPQKKWKEWVGKMAALHEPIWKRAGIFEAIVSSTCQISRNYDLIVGIAEKWCSETKSFVFPWGEATVTLEDLMVSGYTVLGSPVLRPLKSEELKEIKRKLKEARSEMIRTKAKKASHHTWIKKFMDSGSEIEHEGFLALWLSRFVFPSSFDVISERVFPIAIHLARGTRIALAPAVLASIYRDLSLLKGKIVALAKLETNYSIKDKEYDGGDNDQLTVTIWSTFQLVQVWVWERFVELQPKPNLLKDGEPRLAQWDNLKSKAENVRLVLDCKDSFNWRPYAKPVEKWDFSTYFEEKEMWVSVNSESSDELLSFMQCLKVSELVGLDCIEQYLPHRVARQFGLDQDLPGNVPRSDGSPEIAWSCYIRPISDAKCYIAAQVFKAGVTTRYLRWWKPLVLAPRAASQDLSDSAGLSLKRSKESAVSLKRKVGGKGAILHPDPSMKKKNKRSFKSLNRKIEDYYHSSKLLATNEEMNHLVVPLPEFRSKSNGLEDTGLVDEEKPAIAESLKRNNEDSDEASTSNHPSKSLAAERETNNPLVPPGFPPESNRIKTPDFINEDKQAIVESSKRKNEDPDEAATSDHPSKPLVAANEINSLFAPPGFPPKCNRFEEPDFVDGDKLTVSEILKSRKNRDDKNMPGQSQGKSSSNANNLAANTSASLSNVVNAEAVENRKNKDPNNASAQSCSHSTSMADNQAIKSLDPREFSVGETVEGHLIGDSDNAYAQLCESQEHEAPRNLEPAAVSSEVVMVTEGAHVTATVNSNGETRSFSFEIRGLEIEANITRLEKMLAERKAAISAKQRT